MKIIVLFAAFALAAADDYYVTGNDHIDMEQFKADPQKLMPFLDCYMERGPCSDLAKSYQQHLAEAVAQACKRCNPNQKYLFNQLLSELKDKLPVEYKAFRTKYDPEDKYFEALEKELFQYIKPTAD